MNPEIRKAAQSTEVATIPQANLLETVMRAASDPSVDPGRLKELLAIGRELQADEAKRQYNAAFASLKRALPVIDKRGVVLNKSGKKQFSYARYDDIHRAITPLLTEYGFATSFDFKEPEKGRLTVVLELTHIAGHSKTYEWTLPAQGDSTFVTNLQNAAAARSFGKRCVLIDALDILCEDTDDDGTLKGVPQKITAEQIAKIQDIVVECENREPGAQGRFMNWLRKEVKAEIISDIIQGEQFDNVMESLRVKMASLGVR